MYTFNMIPPRTSGMALMIVAILIPFLISIFLGINLYMLKHVKFNIDRNELQIKGGLYKRVLSKDELDLDSVSIVDLNNKMDLAPVIKRNGIGLPGIKEGWFKLRNGEKALLFLTDTKNVVYIRTLKGYALLLSVSNPEEFVKKLRAMG